MDPVNVGFLSILPPIIAIVLALITKEVISSLMIGIFFGTFTYAIASHTGFMGAIQTTFDLMSSKIGDNAMMLIFLSLLGVIVVLTMTSGGSEAYGTWAATKIKNKKQALVATSVLGILIFVDDYFNCLTVGTVMKPLTDEYKVARAKLAYIIDSTAAPVCIIAPISSWAAAVGATLAGAHIFKSDIMAFVSTIPFNLYAILTILMVFTLSATGISYGPMRKFEKMADQGDLGINPEGVSEEAVETNGKVMDLVIPIVALIVFSVLAMLYTGGYFSGKGIGFMAAFGNCNSSASLAWGGFGAIIVAMLLYLPRKIMGFTTFMSCVGDGVKTMVPAILILIMAWTISGVCTILKTGVYIGGLVQASHFPLVFVPVIIFIVAAFLSFSTGTSWGTFGILIPIVVIICKSALVTNPSLMVVTLAATLGGSVFGDHCSPISDTTILSSTGANCPHIDHVSTQLPYALTVAVSCVVGYFVSAATHFSLIATLLSGIVTLYLLMFILSKIWDKKEADEAASETEA
ncbi:MAG: Na+/H+ antiporter NhaC family protein [Eubacteriaceae bacterium]|jgi:Na+/H+ antiporter NhaC|nr:Na+/H+ antiporter NhaC family protein [Eubacteriaceae bacterium]